MVYQRPKSPPKELSDKDLRKRAQSAFKEIERDVKKEADIWRKSNPFSFKSPKPAPSSWNFAKKLEGELVSGDPHSPLYLAQRIVNNEDIERYLYKKSKTVKIGGRVGVKVDAKRNSAGVIIDDYGRVIDPKSLSLSLDTKTMRIVFTLDDRPIDQYSGGGSIEKLLVDASKETKGALSTLTLKKALEPFKDALR